MRDLTVSNMIYQCRRSHARYAYCIEGAAFSNREQLQHQRVTRRRIAMPVVWKSRRLGHYVAANACPD